MAESGFRYTKIFADALSVSGESKMEALLAKRLSPKVYQQVMKMIRGMRAEGKKEYGRLPDPG